MANNDVLRRAVRYALFANAAAAAVVPVAHAADPAAPDEALVMDPRGGLSPAQMVDRKLASLMQVGTLPVSRFQATVLLQPLTDKPVASNHVTDASYLG